MQPYYLVLAADVVLLFASTVATTIGACALLFLYFTSGMLIFHLCGGIGYLVRLSPLEFTS